MPGGHGGQPWLALLLVGVCMIVTYAFAFQGLRRVTSAVGVRRVAWMVLDLLLAAGFVALGAGGALEILTSCFAR